MAYTDEEYKKGRGAQVVTENSFLKHSYVKTHPEGLDEPWEYKSATTYYLEHAKKILNKVDSPDVGPGWSMNPYQGCEHGCIYCYARNTHEYYGFSAGLDFESRIIIKKNAAELLRKHFEHPKWTPEPIMLAGNTDCYQPAERKEKITRSILEACLEYNHPVGIITKNYLVTRDADILQELAARRLVHVNISITTLNEDLRSVMEPRTASARKRLDAIKILSEKGIPVRVMAAPMIPFLNTHELPDILQAASENGALDAGYVLVRLNGKIGEIFTDWIHKAFPDKADRVLSQIKQAHGGKLNDSRFGTRMRGEGEFAVTISKLYKQSKKRFFAGKVVPEYDLSVFRRPGPLQMSLF